MLCSPEQPKRRLWPFPALVLALLSFPAAGGAQQAGSITGQVVDAATNRPLPSVQLVVEGTGLGTISASDGRYLIVNVPAGTQRLRAQLIGYESEVRQVSVQAGQAAVARFALTSEAVELEEVVVTGTAGAARRREIGNSVGTISQQQLEITPVTTTSQILYGQTTGLQQFANEGQVGAGSTILLRGINSITQGTQPLIYIDGIRINIEGNPGPVGAQTSPSALDNLNPNDIARVEVIRGAAATTLYGTEAAGGVIQIFTKQGQTGQQASWQMQTTLGGRFQTGNGLGPVVGKHESYMFLKPYLRTGAVRNGDLSVTGGTEAMRYYLSGSYGYDEGVIPNNSSERVTVRGNFGFAPTPTLRVEASSMFSRRSSEFVQSGDNTYGFLLNVLRGNQDYTGDRDSTIFDIDTESSDEHFVGGVTLTHAPSALPITNRVMLGIDYTNAFNRMTIPFDWLLLPEGRRETNRWQHTTLTAEYTGNWAHKFSDALASTLSWGGQIFEDSDHTQEGYAEGFAGPGEKTLSSGAVSRSEEDLLRVINGGFFVQELIGIQDRLFVTAGLRVDGNSAFGEDFGLQAYPKASVSYVLSDHDFWPGWWPVMKLRGAIGESGKAPGAFDAVRTWDPVSGYEGKPGVTPANLGNPNLGPERTREVELGFEGSLFENRIGVDFTWYRSRTFDALFPVTEPPSMGFLGSQLRNVGELENRGIELSITGTPIATDWLHWDVTGRLSTNESEILDLGGAPPFIVGFGALGQWVREGYPVLSYFGAKVMNPDEVAAPVVQENQYYGPMYPTHNLSLSTTLNVARRLTFAALGEYAGGHVQFNIMPWQSVRRGLWPECNDRQPLEQQPAIWRARCAGRTPRFDFWTRPADYFKLRNLSLTYEMPAGLVPGATRSSLTVLGQNLWKSQQSPGLDPENTRLGTDNSVFPARYEYYQLPPAQVVTVTLRVNF